MSPSERIPVLTLDNRGLEPPQPMIRTLEQLEQMEEDQVLVIHNDRQPLFLYSELDERGYVYEEEAAEDGGWRVTIRNQRRDPSC